MEVQVAAELAAFRGCSKDGNMVTSRVAVTETSVVPPKAAQEGLEVMDAAHAKAASAAECRHSSGFKQGQIASSAAVAGTKAAGAPAAAPMEWETQEPAAAKTMAAMTDAQPSTAAACGQPKCLPLEPDAMQVDEVPGGPTTPEEDSKKQHDGSGNNALSPAARPDAENQPPGQSNGVLLLPDGNLTSTKQGHAVVAIGALSEAAEEGAVSGPNKRRKLDSTSPPSAAMPAAAPVKATTAAAAAKAIAAVPASSAAAATAAPAATLPQTAAQSAAATPPATASGSTAAGAVHANGVAVNGAGADGATETDTEAVGAAAAHGAADAAHVKGIAANGAPVDGTTTDAAGGDGAAANGAAADAPQPANGDTGAATTAGAGADAAAGNAATANGAAANAAAADGAAAGPSGVGATAQGDGAAPLSEAEQYVQNTLRAYRACVKGHMEKGVSGLGDVALDLAY